MYNYNTCFKVHKYRVCYYNKKSNLKSVMLVLRGIQNANSFILLGSLLLCLLLTIQIKQIYVNNQKYNRYLGYEQYINEISKELKTIEKTANKSSIYVHHLNEILYKHRERDTKNASLSRIAKLLRGETN